MDNNPENTLMEVKQMTTKKTSSFRTLASMQTRTANTSSSSTTSLLDSRSKLPEEYRWYWNVHSQLAINDNLIIYGCRLLIPSQECTMDLQYIICACS